MNVPGMANANPKRTRALVGIALLVAVAGLVYGIYWYLYLSHYEDTDDAYVQGNVVQVTPQVAGTVVQVRVQDTEMVSAGQSLVALDPSDSKIELEASEALLAQAVREVRQVYGNDASSVADIRFREADLARASSELARVEQDLSRRRELARRQVISREDLSHAQATVDAARSAQRAAQAALQGAQSQLSAGRSITEGVDVASHPKVQAAASRVRQALVGWNRTQLNAPVGGIVAKRSVQLGQRVQAGAPMMAIVPLEQVWVDANFKEVQLRRMRVGQPALLTADQFGKDVAFHGRVAGFAAGTGAAFALIPAQNATGNWIKVVQRVPVRISLDPAELREHPLRLGLSMKVEVDVADGKPAPASVARARAPAVLADSGDQAKSDLLVSRIIADNLGQGAATSHAAR
jgi:membrane fusion protein (multidrug efflux system)